MWGLRIDEHKTLNFRCYIELKETKQTYHFIRYIFLPRFKLSLNIFYKHGVQLLLLLAGGSLCFHSSNGAIYKDLQPKVSYM